MPQVWEHGCVKVVEPSDISEERVQTILDQWQSDGWELIIATHSSGACVSLGDEMFLFFKRPKKK